MGEQIETVPAGVPVRRGTGDLAMPAVTAAQMVAGLEAYRELQKSLDKAMPDQIMDLDGKPFRKKGYWRAISLAFNLTVEMVSEERKVGGFFRVRFVGLTADDARAACKALSAKKQTCMVVAPGR